jgi:general L-amino acid transport system substrate-binding protein
MAKRASRCELILWASLLFLFWRGMAAGAAMDDVRGKAQLTCGIAESEAGFSMPGAEGARSGFDADFCRAVAAAVLGSGAKVNFVLLPPTQRLRALQTGEVDLVARASPWTMRTDTAPGISFAGVIYYEGQGLMVRRKLEVQSALELSGAEICAVAGTGAELNIADFFSARGMPFKTMISGTAAEALKAYEAGRCDAYLAGMAGLVSARQTLASPEDHVILPESVAKEAYAPAVRQGDPQWLSVVRWTLFALIDAEELGVSRDNARELTATSAVPAVKRLLGGGEDYGRRLGLGQDWALRAIEAAGNYGEIFERNLGIQSPLKLERAENRLWSRDGLLFAPPVR